MGNSKYTWRDPEAKRLKLTREFLDACRPAIKLITETSACWYVYAHIMDGEIAYIGKGHKNRAYDCTGRSSRWFAALDKCSAFSINILSWHETDAQSKEAERLAIMKHAPLCNKAIPNPPRPPVFSLA